MAKCKKCGAELEPGEKFCGNCGAEVVISKEKTIDTKNATDSKIDNKVSNLENSKFGIEIPGTKKELYDFIISASVNIKYDKGSRDTWKANLEKAFLKAKSLYTENSTEFVELKEAYNSSINYINKEKSKKTKFIAVAGVLVAVLVAVFIIVGNIGNDTGITRASVSLEEVTEPLYEGEYVCGSDDVLKPGKNFFKFVATTSDEKKYEDEYINNEIWIQGGKNLYAPDNYETAKKGKVYSITLKKGTEIHVNADYGEWYFYKEK